MAAPSALRRRRRRAQRANKSACPRVSIQPSSRRSLSSSKWTRCSRASASCGPTRRSFLRCSCKRAITSRSVRGARRSARAPLPLVTPCLCHGCSCGTALCGLREQAARRRPLPRAHVRVQAVLGCARARAQPKRIASPEAARIPRASAPATGRVHQLCARYLASVPMHHAAYGFLSNMSEDPTEAPPV